MRNNEFLTLLIFFMMGFTLVMPVSQRYLAVASPIDDTFQNSDNLGYEFLENDTVLHIWNRFNNYYFNVSNGMQFSNHFQEYWTHNVLMVGYYAGDNWDLLFRTDELSGFNKNLSGVSNVSINATLWKDLSYGPYDFRLAIRYNLGVNATDLTVIPYVKNLGVSIPFDIGFGWELKDIEIDTTPQYDYIDVNRTQYLLNQTLNNVYHNLSSPIYNGTNIMGWTDPMFEIREDVSPTEQKYLYLIWNKSLNYILQVKNRTNQYNAPVTLFIKVGPLEVDQEKSTELHWLDADTITFFIDAYEVGEGGWQNNPAYMVDGILTNFASTNLNVDLEIGVSNTCNGSDLGTISKVEIRGYGYVIDPMSDVILETQFGYESVCGFSTSAGWSNYFDVTYRDGSWTWADVDDLRMIVISNIHDGLAFVSKEEIRVTYTGASKEWCVADVWSLTFGNSTLKPYVSDTWSLTFGNSTLKGYVSDVWSLTFGNSTLKGYVSDTWSLTFGNSTLNPYVSDVWSLSFGNSTLKDYVSDTWSLTFGNSTLKPYVSDVWSLSFGNSTLKDYVSDTWSLTFGNSTLNPYVSDTWSLTFGNSTSIPYVSDTWSLTFGNSTLKNYVSDVWNLTFSNSSSGIFLENEYPINQSTDATIDFNWSIEISNTEGLFNWTINCSNNQSSNGTNDLDGRKNLLLSDLEYDIEYTVWVNVSDSDISKKAWYLFTVSSELKAGFTYSVDGVNIRCTSTSTGNIKAYKWELLFEGVSWGSTSWIEDISGKAHVFTCSEKGYYSIVHCVKSYLNDTECKELSVGKILIYKDVYPPDVYDYCLECEDAGYFWYQAPEDDNEICHKYPKPSVYNDTGDKEYDDAGDLDKGKIKIGDWNVEVGWVIIPIGIFLVFLFIPRKGGSGYSKLVERIVKLEKREKR